MSKRNFPAGVAQHRNLGCGYGAPMTWPRDTRTRELAVRLYESVKDRPLVSVHNGLPARYLAEDLPVTDPLHLLVSHDQGVQALLRAHGVRTEFSPIEGWQSESSRRAFALLWDHLVAVRAQPWMDSGGDKLAALARASAVPNRSQRQRCL